VREPYQTFPVKITHDKFITKHKNLFRKHRNRMQEGNVQAALMVAVNYTFLFGDERAKEVRQRVLTRRAAAVKRKREKDEERLETAVVAMQAKYAKNKKPATQ
jgi:hypothetical protein